MWSDVPVLSDAEEELEREILELRAALARERRARELRSAVNQLAAATSGEVSRTGVAQVIADGASDLFDAAWTTVAFVGDDRVVTFVHGPGVPADLRDRWTTVPLATDVPMCAVLRGDVDRIELSDDAAFGRWPLLEADAERAGIGSVVVRPIGSGDPPTAAIAIAWADAHAVDSVEAELLGLLLDRTGPAFDRSERTEVDGLVAEVLQTSLLDRHPPELAGVEVATLYEPGRDVLAVGGDWYDVLDLGGSRGALVIGDVVGHDVRAAVAMSQVREVLAAHLVATGDPVRALELTDAHLRHRAPGVMATALVVVVDGTRLTPCSAGHLPPLVWSPTGGGALLPCGLGPPLGTGLGPQSRHDVDVDEGSVVVAFTDGLVETRTGGIDADLEALVALATAVLGDAASPGERVGALAEALAARVDVPWRTDDAAAVVARLA